MKNLNSEEIKALLAAIDDLIDIKIIIREIVPNYNLSEAMYKNFLSKLESLQQKLKPVFSAYLNTEDKSRFEDSEDIKKKLLELVKNNMKILISANSSKKKLKSIGIDPRHIIVSGGPLVVDDYKIVNPNLSEKALENINKKCQSLIRQLKNENWSNYNLIFIHEKENITDTLILKKINIISNIIGKKVNTFELKAWNNLEI